VSIRYLILCKCGQKTPVELFEAGGEVNCRCGEKVEVPRLLELKKLEKVVDVQKTERSPSKWGAGKGIALAGLVLLLGLAALGGWMYRCAPYDPLEVQNNDHARAYFKTVPPYYSGRRGKYASRRVSTLAVKPRRKNSRPHLPFSECSASY
jgi:hypothetical protein